MFLTLATPPSACPAGSLVFPVLVVAVAEGVEVDLCRVHVWGVWRHRCASCCRAPGGGLHFVERRLEMGGGSQRLMMLHVVSGPLLRLL